MKKTFILAAMAAAVALGFTACGSDDDDYVAPKHDVVLPVPTSAKNAVAFDQMVDTNGNPIKSGGKTLKGITFTETGNAVAEIDGDYVVGKYTAKDGIYTLSGSVKGIVKDLTTRATGRSALVSPSGLPWQASTATRLGARCAVWTIPPSAKPTTRLSTMARRILLTPRITISLVRFILPIWWMAA